MRKSIYSKYHRVLVEHLKKARKEAGLNHRQATKRLGKAMSYLSYVERGQIRIDVVQLKEFAKLYKKDWIILVSRNDRIAMMDLEQLKSLLRRRHPKYAGRLLSILQKTLRKSPQKYPS